MLPGGPDSSKCYSLPQQGMEELSESQEVRKGREGSVCVVVDLASSSLPARRLSAVRVCASVRRAAWDTSFVHRLRNHRTNISYVLLYFAYGNI